MPEHAVLTGNLSMPAAGCWGLPAGILILRAAIERTYQAVSNISFHGMQYRKDIGQKGLQHLNPVQRIPGSRCGY